LGAGAQSLHGSDRRRGAHRLDSQAFAAFGATCVDYRAAATSFHADQEAMGAGAADFGGLVSAFHLDFLTKRCRHFRLFINIVRKDLPAKFPKGFLGKA
jgi:hypothetical protein